MCSAYIRYSSDYHHANKPSYIEMQLTTYVRMDIYQLKKVKDVLLSAEKMVLSSRRLRRKVRFAIYLDSYTSIHPKFYRHPDMFCITEHLDFAPSSRVILDFTERIVTMSVYYSSMSHDINLLTKAGINRRSILDGSHYSIAAVRYTILDIEDMIERLQRR